VPRLIGIDNSDFVGVLKSFGNREIDEIAEDPGLGRDVVEFLALSTFGGGRVLLRFDREDDVFREGDPAAFVLNAQFPAPGTLVPDDAEILTMWVDKPPTA
jgi:hypothetical protein